MKLAAVAFVLAASASGQTVDDVVARYLAARGGRERIRAVSSLRMTGTISPVPGQGGPFRLELKRPGKMRVEATVQGMTFTQATDGQAAWVVAPALGGGGAVLLPPEEAASLQDQADMEGPLVDWVAKGHKVELAGRETRFGGEAFRLKVRRKGGETRTVYIDAQTYRQVAEEGERPTPAGLVLVETRLSDHRMVDGLLVPFVLDINAGGGERQRVAFEKVEVDVPLDDSRFAPPEGAKRAPKPPGD
jgi:hypothetical protein